MAKIITHFLFQLNKIAPESLTQDVLFWSMIEWFEGKSLPCIAHSLNESDQIEILAVSNWKTFWALIVTARRNTIGWVMNPNHPVENKLKSETS